MHWQSILQVHRLASFVLSMNFQNRCVILAFLFSFVVKSICLLRKLCSVPFRVQKLSSVLLSLVLRKLKLELEPCLVRLLVLRDKYSDVIMSYLWSVMAQNSRRLWRSNYIESGNKLSSLSLSL